MQHLSHERLYTTALDEESLSAAERSHLETCERCMAEAQGIAALVHDLRVARRSEPSSQALERYAEIFREHGPARQGALQRAWNWVTASLVSDSRVQPLPAGTRSVRADGYRLLYDSPQADIELFVEGEGTSRRLQGDVILLDADENGDDGTDQGEMLVQLQDGHTVDIVQETVTGSGGRFHLEDVRPGEYRLLVTGPEDMLLEIGELRIT